MPERVTAAEYRALAELRHRIRMFLREGDETALSEGLEPQQYQMLLAIRGLDEGELATVGTLAERLAIRHHSAVELIDRLERGGFVCPVRLRERQRDQQDQRVHNLHGSKCRCGLSKCRWQPRANLRFSVPPYGKREWTGTDQIGR